MNVALDPSYGNPPFAPVSIWPGTGGSPRMGLGWLAQSVTLRLAGAECNSAVIVIDNDETQSCARSAPAGLESSGVAKSYFSPRKITLRYASPPIANSAVRLVSRFKFPRRISNPYARSAETTRDRPIGRWRPDGPITDVADVIMDT